MKRVIELCCSGNCPKIELHEDKVLIGELDNTCELTMDQWNTLKDKIINNEL